jgi:hypothetical protein
MDIAFSCLVKPGLPALNQTASGLMPAVGRGRITPSQVIARLGRITHTGTGGMRSSACAGLDQASLQRQPGQVGTAPAPVKSTLASKI